MDQKLDRTEELRALERQLQEKGLAGVDRYYRIQRPVYKEIRSLFDQGYEHTLNDPDKTPSLISVYGEGGVGKSGIVEDLRGHLDDKGLSYILFALDSNIYSGIHSKTIKLLDEIVRRFYNKDRFVFLEYVLISECFHSVWDKGTETIFEEKDSIFEKTFIDVAKETIDKLLDTVAPLPRKLISMFGSYVGSRVEGKIEDELIKKNFRNIQGNEEVGAGIVVETFCKCMNSYLAEEKPLIVILDNSETIYDEFSQESQEQLNDVFLELKNTVWYFSGREPFRKVAEKESTGRRGKRKEQLHVIYREGAIEGISIDEIIELTLRRGILVENKMITNSMARALNDASGGNLRWINAKIMAMQKVQKNDILDAEKFNEIAQASEKDVLVRLIHTEFKEYRDEEKTFLLYGCIPQASNEFINEVDRRLNDFSLVHKAEQQWYKSEYEDGYIFSPMVALVLQRYIKEELAKGTNSYIKSFIDSVYEVLIGINRDRRDLESVRIGSQFISLFRSPDDCISFAREFTKNNPIKLRIIFNTYFLNTASGHIYRYFSDMKGKRLFLNEENRIEYQLKILNSYLSAEFFTARNVQYLAKGIKERIEKLPSVTIEGMRTPRVEYDIDLLNTCIALSHRRDDGADRQMDYILSMMQTESRIISDLMEIGYAGYEKIVEDQLNEYDYYLNEGIITDPDNKRMMLAYKGRFYQQCHGYLPGALDEARKIMDELVEQTREVYGEESLEMASILKDYHSFARRFRMEEEADQTITAAFKILKDHYLEYNEENKRQAIFVEVRPILDNLGDWMADSTWRKTMHGMIEEQFKEILKSDSIVREYRNIMSRSLLSSYSANDQYQKAIEFITDTYDPDDLSYENMVSIQRAISGDLYYIEELYRNYPLYVNNTNKERFVIFDMIATRFIDWYKKESLEIDNPKYDSRRIHNTIDYFIMLIDYYRNHYGICQSDNPLMSFNKAMSGFLYVANDQQENSGKWYGIERDLERSLLVFLLIHCFDERENLYRIIAKRQNLLQRYEEDEFRKNNTGYNVLRKIWYLDLIHGSIKTLGIKIDSSIREHCILQSVTWMNYVPNLDKKNTREALKDMYYGIHERGFAMLIMDVASFLKKLAANFNSKANVHISTSIYLKVWLDSYRNICSMVFVSFYKKRRYKAMLIEMLNNNRFYRDGKTYFVFKEPYLNYLENIDEKDEGFWCDYFDIYTSFMSVTSQQEEALEYIKQKVEEVPNAIRFSLYRRLSLLNEQLGLRDKALADMKKAIDLLEPRIGEKRTYKEKYISYLQHIRPLFTQSKDALQYMREKRNMFKKQEDIDFDVIYALDDIIRMYDQRTVE